MKKHIEHTILTFAFYKLMEKAWFTSAGTSNNKELKQKIWKKRTWPMFHKVYKQIFNVTV